MLSPIEEEYTAKQAQERLGISSYGKFRQLVEDLKAVRHSQGRELRKGGDGGWRFSQEDMEALERAHALVSVGERTHASVVRVLSVPVQHGGNTAAAEPQQAPSGGGAAQQHESSTAAALDVSQVVAAIEELADRAAFDPAAVARALAPHVADQVDGRMNAMQARVEGALEQSTKMGMALAEAGRRVGQLEAENGHLRAKLDEADRQLRQLAAPKPPRPFWKFWG